MLSTFLLPIVAAAMAAPVSGFKLLGKAELMGTYKKAGK
jgi:hypothetical protein